MPTCSWRNTSLSGLCKYIFSPASPCTKYARCTCAERRTNSTRCRHNLNIYTFIGELRPLLECYDSSHHYVFCLVSVLYRFCQMFVPYVLTVDPLLFQAFCYSPLAAQSETASWVRTSRAHQAILAEVHPGVCYPVHFGRQFRGSTNIFLKWKPLVY